MGTRSVIGKMNKDGSIDFIHCHWDGYPDYNGIILHEAYLGNNEKIDKLLSLGDLSSLRELVDIPEGKKHSFDKPLEDVCIAYHRDRGEELNPARHANDIDDFVRLLEHEDCPEYAYIFSGENLEAYSVCIDWNEKTHKCTDTINQLKDNWYEDAKSKESK